MTAQISDKLIFRGETYFLATEPLNKYLYQRGIQYLSMSSACWRGYVASWEVKDDKLFLVDIHTNTENGEEIGLSQLFPKQKEVFAEWFSGELRVPYGELLAYIHGGYHSIYERDLFLYFENGLLYGTQEKDNYEEYQRYKKRQDDLPW